MTHRSHTAGRTLGGVVFRTALTLCAAWTATACGETPARRTESPGPDTVVVNVLPAAATTNREVTIADVATVSGGPSALRTQIAKLDLTDAPQTGKSTTISQHVIAYRIQIAGIDLRRFRIQGAASTVISVRKSELSHADVLSAARQYLLTRLPWDPDDISIELAQTPREPMLVAGPPGDRRIEVTVRSNRVPLGNIRADVAIWSAGVKQAEFPVTLEVHLHQTVAVATRRIDRGQSLTAENVSFERRVVDSNTEYLTEQESPIGQRARRPILPLQPVAKTDVEPQAAEVAAVVKQRDVVRLVARAGGLVVTAAGEALQDGRPGQMIRVRNVDSKTVVTGRVVSRDEVRVLQ